MKLYNEIEGRINKLGKEYPELLPLMQPTAKWFGVGGKKRVKNTFDQLVNNYIKRCHEDIPVIVIYNIPNRDLGSYSKGGAGSADDYLFFINEMVQGLGENSNAIVILEPDALAQCGDDYDLLKFRTVLLLEACRQLKTTGAKIYIDIGHPGWLSPLGAATVLYPFMGIVDGCSINVSNYWSTEKCHEYAKDIYEQTELPSVIDTSRNGGDHDPAQWCNPTTQTRIGLIPTIDVEAPWVDAYLWIKVPGESDGTCNNGPKAGIFWLDYARRLAK